MVKSCVLLLFSLLLSGDMKVEWESSVCTEKGGWKKTRYPTGSLPFSQIQNTLKKVSKMAPLYFYVCSAFVNF